MTSENKYFKYLVPTEKIKIKWPIKKKQKKNTFFYKLKEAMCIPLFINWIDFHVPGK